MFRTGFQEQHFKLAPKGLKYLRLIIINHSHQTKSAQPVPRTDHGKLSYIASTLLPVDLDYLDQQIECHS